MITAASDLRALAGKVGRGATLTPGDISNSDYDNAVARACGRPRTRPSAAPAAPQQGFQSYKKNYLNPRIATKEALLAQADELERRGHQRATEVNRLLVQNGKRPIPTPERPTNTPITSNKGRPVLGPNGEKGTLAAGHDLPAGWSYR